jgi:integrase
MPKEGATMARKVKDKSIDTREARGKLKARAYPYWRQIDRGLHLGYRRNRVGGTWWARFYKGEQQYEVESLGIADDLSDADGIRVLGFFQAQDKARQRATERAKTAAGITGPLTVRDAVESYIEWLESNRKTADGAGLNAEALIYPKLGDLECAALTTDVIHQVHVWLSKQPARVRTKSGKPQQFRKFDSKDPEDVRRRRCTANRLLTTLKGALNRAWRAGKVPSDLAWRKVEAFKSVNSARIRYLTIADATRLINACDSAFRQLVQGALETGARYGELARLQVCDFNPDSGTVHVRKSKGGKERHIILTADGVTLFRTWTAGRAGSEILFRKADGGAWGKSHQQKPIAEAGERAKIDPPANFHVMRHTWASHSVMNGVPLLVVAKNLGHADTRMVETHYGHLAPSFVVDAIRKGAPVFNVPDESNVTRLG